MRKGRNELEAMAQIMARIQQRLEVNMGYRQAGQKEGACGHTVGLIEKRQADGSWKLSEVACKECENKRNAAEAVTQFKAMQKRKAADKLTLYSTMNQDQLESTFAGYDPENESQAEAKAAAEKLVNAIIAENKDIKGLLFGGSFGIGKSHLAAAACNAIVAAGKSAAFVSISQLKRKITSTFNNGAKVTAEEIMDYLKSVDLLVIDDIGQNAQSEFVDETLFDLLESRQGKAHIFTTNLSGRDLIDALNPRIYERIKKGSLPKKIEGESRRRFALDAEWDF